MTKPSDYFKKLDLAHLDANTAQFIREKILTLPNIDVLEGTKEFETIKAIVEESFPRAIGIEPVVVAPIVEEIPEPIIESVVEPIIDTKQEEIKTISGEIAEMTDLVDLLNEVVAENPQDLDSMDVLELYKETLVELRNKLKSLTEVITEAVSEVKDNIEEVKEVIKTDVVDTKGILTAPKKYKTEDGEEVLGYESDWNFGTKKHLGETVVYYSYKEGISGKYSVLTGILHKGQIVYSEDKISNKEFENKFDSEKEALDFAYEISLDKDSVDKYENGGQVGDKLYYEQHGIGKAKYTVSYYDGIEKHKDGSPFYNIRTFKNKKDLQEFISKLSKEGYRYKDNIYTTKYVAVHESKDGYWTIASKPTTKEDAEAMLGGTPKNEVGKVVTLEEAKAHKKTVGEEYLYEKGGFISNTTDSIIPNLLIELWLAVHEKRTDDYGSISEKLDINKVPFSVQNKVSESATELRYKKAIDVLEVKDIVSKILSDYLNKEAEDILRVGKIETDIRNEENNTRTIIVEIKPNKEYALIVKKNGNVIKLSKAQNELTLLLNKNKYQKGGSVKSFSPESLIGYSFLGNVESSTIISVKEISKDNIKLERKSNVGELKYESSFTLKELKDLYSGKKVGQYEAFKLVMENGGEIKNIDKIKKSIGETVFNHINSLNKEQLEKQLKELKSEMQRDYFESNGKTDRYKKLNDEKVYILNLLERANLDYEYPVGRKVSIADYPKNESNNYTVVGHENYNEKYGWETIIENENEKVTIYENRLEPSIEKLTISSDNPLSSQLRKMTGDTWNAIDFESTEKGHHLSTKTPFRHIKTGRIFQVIN